MKQTTKLIKSQQTKDLLAAIAGAFLLTIEYLLGLAIALGIDLKSLLLKGIEQTRRGIDKARARYQQGKQKPTAAETVTARPLHRKALLEE